MEYFVTLHTIKWSFRRVFPAVCNRVCFLAIWIRCQTKGRHFICLTRLITPKVLKHRPPFCTQRTPWERGWDCSVELYRVCCNLLTEWRFVCRLRGRNALKAKGRWRREKSFQRCHKPEAEFDSNLADWACRQHHLSPIWAARLLWCQTPTSFPRPTR